MLQGRVAVIHGGGGVLGGAMAKAMAGHGARIFLASRTLAKAEAHAAAIRATGGQAEAARVDALDSSAVEAHAGAVMATAGRIDIAVNAIGVAHVQGVPLMQLGLDDYAHPVETYTRTNFITAKAAARHMITGGHGGVLILISTPAGIMPGPGFMGHNSACAAIEGMTRHLAGELGAQGIRVVCLRSHAIPDAVTLGSHSRDVFEDVATKAGLSVDQMLAGAAQTTLLKRMPRLADFAETAAFVASDHAGAMTGAIVNLTCGAFVD